MTLVQWRLQPCDVANAEVKWHYLIEENRRTKSKERFRAFRGHLSNDALKI